MSGLASTRRSTDPNRARLIESAASASRRASASSSVKVVVTGPVSVGLDAARIAQHAIVVIGQLAQPQRRLDRTVAMTLAKSLVPPTQLPRCGRSVIRPVVRMAPVEWPPAAVTSRPRGATGPFEFWPHHRFE